MAQRGRSRGRTAPAGRLKAWAAKGAAVIVISVFGGSAIFGQNGVIAFGGYSRALEQKQVELAEVRAARDALQHRVDLLDPKRANPDMVDELVRKELGVAHPDEVIIPLD